MERNMQGDDALQNGRQGTGSAEQTGREREAQQQNSQQNISEEMGNDKDRLSSIEELGGFSGRDDYAGGSGDDMSSENTGDATDR